MPYFDQLFERLPNGTYREREKLLPKLDASHCNDYFWHPKTGKLCILYAPVRVTFSELPAIDPNKWGRMTEEEFLKLMPGLSGYADSNAPRWLWGGSANYQELYESISWRSSSGGQPPGQRIALP